MSCPEIALIWAQAQGGEIGCQGGIPWQVPEDLTHFRRLTQGHPVIMGRATWQSLPPRFRPLPGRENLVITRQLHWQAPDARVCHSLPEALHAASAAHPEQVWIIGGAQVYAAALPYAHRLAITKLDLQVAGDTFAPAWDQKDWDCLQRDPVAGWSSSATGIGYCFEDWRRHGVPETVPATA